MTDTVIRNIGLLATPRGKSARKGAEQGEISFLKDAWILVEDGTIKEVGTGASPNAEHSYDAGGKLATPGLVDAHTHLVFGGWRQNEMGLKLHGAGYLDILAAGGGILSTVQQTRNSSFETLYDKAAEALGEMFRLGVTTAEAKSGYGLDRETEIRQLEVIRSLNEKQSVELAATFLGAHALPEEYKDNREGYLSLLCDEVIPLVAEKGLAEFCDVFCEQGVFTAAESKRILETGKQYGLLPKIHADEIESIGGSELCEEVGAVSAEHLIVVKQSGIEAMAKAGSVACCLPATSFYLNSTYAPVREMIEAGVPVAISTDFNPGSCPSLNIQLVMNLACLKYRMTPEEMLTAVTLNGAAAIRRAESIGSLEKGKQADIVLWDAPDLDYLGYRLGSNLARTIIKKGHIYEV